MTTLNAQLCTPEEQQISAIPNAPLHCLTRDESIPLSFLAETSFVSLVACLVAYSLIIRNVLYYARRMPGRWRLIKVPMDIYLLSLFAADIFLALAGLLTAKWVQDGKSQIGTWCSAQAVAFTIGSTTVALNILAIAVHNFLTIWCRIGLHANHVACIAVGASWLYSITYVTLVGALHSHEPNSIFRPSPLWCWMGPRYLVHRIIGAYVWMWLALGTSLFSYIPLFFLIRGNITVYDKFWDFSIHRLRDESVDDAVRRRRAMIMIAYPLVYSFLILPLSAVRWLGFVQENRGNRTSHISTELTVTVEVFECMSGICNVLLFLLTRPHLLLFDRSVFTIPQNGNPVDHGGNPHNVNLVDLGGNPNRGHDGDANRNHGGDLNRDHDGNANRDHGDDPNRDLDGNANRDNGNE